jgi:hypothetical protein
MDGFIHILLVIAIVVLLVRIFKGERSFDHCAGEHKKGVENGTRHWNFDCSNFGVFDCLFIASNIRKEGKMGFVIGVLVVIAVIVFLSHRT